ncbi:MAG TPA: hypothetical protein VG347_00835 [Verrucomicrobiae bacterium]|nr:hypothetical protein [Verrucomicrobiae bacterium]
MNTKPILTPDQLQRLGEIYLGLQMAGTFGGMEQTEATAVMAGIVATLHTILSPEQFRGVMILWEVDAIKLSEYLHLAQINEAKTGGKDFIEA